MNFTKSRWLRAARWAAVGTIAMMAAAHVNAQAITTTTVDGTVYLASGQPASGTVQISWPAFTTAASQAVAAGRTSVTIGAGGLMSVNLAPNQGASPAGLYYTAVYYLSDGTTSTEYWVVPAAAQATLAQVRAQVMPAAQALQTASKAYVDQAVQSVSQGSLITSGGTIAGPLYLNGDPTTALQAATKQYVDASAAARASLTATGRQSFAGPITTPGITSSVNGVINVLAPPYNAKGDGVTDDHDAIVAACNAAKASNPPAVVYFPLTTAGKYLTSTIVNSCMGVSMEGPLSSSGISSTSPRVTIQGEPGEDLFEQQAPGTYSGAAPARSWSIRDLNLVIDTSVAGSHPHRWPGRWITDAGMTSGSAVITSPHALFSCGDVGQAIKVDGAGASGADLVTTIASVSPCLSDTPTVTLAATASTTVSNAHAYISLGGLPVTTAVGSCVMAWDDSDGNSANNTTSGPIGNQDDSFYNVSFSSLSPANTYGDYNTCGLFFQGQWGPYALSAREVAVNGLYFGVLQTGSELNPYLNSASGDFEKWDHGLWRNMTFPWISYNGGDNSLSDIQINGAVVGPQLLEYQNTFGDVLGSWKINIAEYTSSAGATYGWRIEGSGHVLTNTALTEDASHTLVTQFDASNSVCTGCGVYGAMTVNGSNNRFDISTTATAAQISNQGASNTFTMLNNAHSGLPNTRPYTVNASRGTRPAGTITEDFINDGNAGNVYFSRRDLFFWPEDFENVTTPGVLGTDSNALTGRYYQWPNDYVSNFGNAFYLGQSTNKITVGSSMLPSLQSMFYISAKCTSDTSFTFQVTAGAATVMQQTFPCNSSSYTTSYTLADFSPSSYVGQLMGMKATGSTGSVRVAWLAIRPFQHDYNGFQPQPGVGDTIYTAQNWSWIAGGSHPGAVDSTSPFGYSTAIGNSWNIGSVNGDSNISGGHMFPAAQSKIGWLISGGTPVFTNTLAAAMGTGDTTLTLTTPTDSTWSASGYIQIDDEVISYSGETPGATTLTIQRAKYGTIAQTHANGAAITSVGVGSVWVSCNNVSLGQLSTVFTSSWTWVYSSFSAQNCSGYNIKFTPSFTGQAGQLYKVAAMAFIPDPAISSPASASLVPVSAGSGPYTWTSSKSLAGSGSGLTTGPTSSTSGNVATFTGTTGQIQDSGTALTTLARYLTGTSSSIGGSALTAGACTSGTVSITGATTAMGVIASPVTYPGDGMTWSGYVSASGTVTVKVCAVVAGTPIASTYNVRVIQ